MESKNGNDRLRDIMQSRLITDIMLLLAVLARKFDLISMDYVNIFMWYILFSFWMVQEKLIYIISRRSVEEYLVAENEKLGRLLAQSPKKGSHEALKDLNINH